ncbi:MAG: dihydroxyacetone kinase subunit DhaK [Thermoguttaceae bacterium]|nr:dihydroxyacetone kinase subunit DhaK [Thermoguttaceae bacterium]
MVMKKFINAPENLTTELLAGMQIAFPDKIVVDQKLVCRANPKSTDKVAIVSMGGTGHEPAISGFVGYGMLDVSVAGDIFAAPGGPNVYKALEKMNREAGTLLIVLNHAGDVMSGDMAMEMAEEEGLNVRSINTHEDISAGLGAPMEDRRGLVGCIPLAKIAGAAAERGWNLDEVCRVANKFNDNMATLAVAMRGATHPATGQEIATLADDEMEIGMGQHGEGGGGRCKIKTADETAQIMAEQLLQAVDAKEGDKVVVIINGSGATTHMEMFIVLNGVKKYLDSKGIIIADAKCEEMLTVQESAGFQMFIAKMDDELLDLWKDPCDTPYWTVR